jgi:hypothetical protein
MKLAGSFLVGILLLLSILLSVPSHAQDEKPPGEKFVYADFEKTESGRTVSNGGGLVQIYTSTESTPVTFKGVPNASPGAPELVRLKTDPQNRLASFEYALTGPNQWAQVTLEIEGHPMKDGKPVADDVSGYKQLSVQLGATGVESLRVEFISHKQGLNIESGFPQLPIRLKPGLNTYLIPLKGLSQPTWVKEQRVDSKEVLKRLTAISISAYCDQCTSQNGMVLVDNLVFQE